MKKTATTSGRKWIKPLLYLTGIVLLLLIAGYFIANSVVRRKVDEALRALPPAWQVKYSSLNANVLTGSLVVKDLEARYRPTAGRGDSLRVEKIEISGISFLQWVTAHRVRVRNVRAEGVEVAVDEELLEKDTSMKNLQSPSADALIDHLEVEDLKVEEKRKDVRRLTIHGELGVDSVTSGGVGAIHFTAADAFYSVPGMDETVRLVHLELDSKKRLLRVDTIKVNPDRDPEEIGRSRGHQVDVVRANLAGISVEDFDVMDLAHRRLKAGEISCKSGRVHVFRDRRLPLDTGEKPMPIRQLKSMPIDLRVGRLRLGSTRFEYEEFPKVGDKKGMLVIERFRARVEPLINKPVAGDPAFITLTTEGSLMGSGSVTATTRMPLHKDGNYEVEGAFHDLDVTRLNNPAENLGQLHLESGMLNLLTFRFEMGQERSTGQIIGEYHDLVADKLKEKNGQLKTDKVKSFALKKLIIPRNKDKSLPVAKRTGKVDYKRDPNRYFSYYLLHSLLVGVKSSFSLGFLLPG